MKKGILALSVICMAGLTGCSTSSTSSTTGTETGSTTTSSTTSTSGSTGTSVTIPDTSSTRKTIATYETSWKDTLPTATVNDGDYSFAPISDYSAVLTSSILTSMQDEAAPSSYDASYTEGAVEIAAGGSYYFKGTFTQIAIKKAVADADVHLYFDGVTISSAKKLIDCASAFTGKLTITCLANSTNTLTCDSASDAKNAISSANELYINGKGTLNISNTGKTCIKNDGNIYLYDITMTLNASASMEGHGISGYSVIGKNATITVTDAGKDGIHAELPDTDPVLTNYVNSAGYIALFDVNFTYAGTGDGIQADSYLYIEGGTYDITSTPTWVLYGSEDATTYGITDLDDFKYKKSGTTYTKVDSEQRKGTGLYAFAQSVKGLRVGAIDQEDAEGTETEISSKLYMLKVSSATLTINTPDDNIHSNYGEVYTKGNTMTLASLDQPLAADGPVTTIDDKINITSSYEGIQGSIVTIDGDDEDLSIVASDDGINATSDYYSDLSINFLGGKVNVNASGDGIDSNGTIWVDGSDLVVQGPTDSGNAPIDSGDGSAGGVFIDSGTVIATGSSGMIESPLSTSKQNSIVYTGSTYSAGSAIVLKDSSGNEVLSTTVTKTGAAVILSSSNILAGGTYTLYINGTSVGSATITTRITTIGTGTSGGQSGPGGQTGGTTGGPGGR